MPKCHCKRNCSDTTEAVTFSYRSNGKQKQANGKHKQANGKHKQANGKHKQANGKHKCGDTFCKDANEVSRKGHI